MYPSLKCRVLKASSGQDTVSTSYGGRGKYNYKSINFDRAITAVEAGESYRRAAEMYGVPRSTIHDHFTGKYIDMKAGPKPYLTTEEEEELISFLDVHAKIGYPYTRKHVLGIVQDIVNTKGIEAEVSSGWWDSFRKKSPLVVLRSAMPFALSRAHATDPEVLAAYFDKLESTLKYNRIFDKAGSIFNCEESGFSLSPKSPKDVVSHITSETKTHNGASMHKCFRIFIATFCYFRSENPKSTAYHR